MSMSRLESGMRGFGKTGLLNLLQSIGLVVARTGSGTPEAVVTAPIGSLYVNTAGGAATTLYVKTSGTGNTGWTAK